MAMPSWYEISAMSDEELAERFDALATSTQPGVAFWGDVLTMRAMLHAAQVQLDQAAETTILNKRLLDLTDRLTLLTHRIYVLTAAAVGVTLVSLVVSLAR